MPPNLLYPTTLTNPQPPTTPPCLFTSPPPPRLPREAAPCIPKPPATSTISHACQTTSNSITDHATNMSCIISMLLLLHLIHPSPNSSPPPPPAPLIPLPQTPQNSHLTQPLQHNETAQQHRCGQAGQQLSEVLPACGRSITCLRPWPGRLPEPSPGRSTGPEMALIFRL